MNVATGAIDTLEELERTRKPGEDLVELKPEWVDELVALKAEERLERFERLARFAGEGEPDPATYRGRLGYGTPPPITRRRRARRS